MVTELQRAAAVRELVRSIMRAIRAMGYYDDNHPVFTRTQHEALDSLQEILSDGEMITLACGGSHVVFDPTAPPLDDDVAKSMAKVMFSRSIIAIQLRNTATLEDVGVLLRALSDTEDRLRREGGVRLRLEQNNVRGIDVSEVNYAELFAGEGADLAHIVSGDPIIERALHGVLRFKEEGEGVELSIKIEDLDNVESLGGFLDELIGKSGPEVTGAAPLALPAGASLPPLEPIGGHISREQFSNIAANGFVSNQDKLRKHGASNREIAASARALSDAMVRIHPHARLDLLRKLAGADQPASPMQAEAVKNLGSVIDSKVVIEAIASVLLDEQSDMEVVNSIGNLIRRLRPVERDRQEMLAELDSMMKAQDRSVNGVVWQEIRARALGKEEMGYLRVAFEDVRDELAAAAQARLAGQLVHVPGQEILVSHRPQMVDRHAASVLNTVLSEQRGVGDTIMGATKELIVRLESDGAVEFSTALLSTLMRRADDHPVGGANRPTFLPGPPSSAPPPGRHSIALQGGLQAMQVSGNDTMPPTLGSNPTMPTMQGLSTVPGGNVRTVLSELLTGPEGTERARRLVQASAGQSTTMAEILLKGIEESTDPAYQEMLLGKLAGLDPRILVRIGEEGGFRSYRRVHYLVRACKVGHINVAVKIVRQALLHGTFEVKQTALKALIDVDDPNTIAFLSAAAGVKGEDTARKLFGLSVDAPGADKGLHALQLTAIGALGLSRAPSAVEPLMSLVVKTAFFSNKELEEIRQGAVRALVNNQTPEAKAALEQGASHKKRQVRDACRRAIAGWSEA